MMTNEFVLGIACITLCLLAFTYGFYKGMNWAYEECEKVLDKSRKNCEEAMRIADEWKESATKLLKEKYCDPTGNGGGFKRGNQN